MSASSATEPGCRAALAAGKISHGTGKYAGISGHGRFRVRALIVARHTAHGCSRRPIAIQVIIRAHGPVTLP